MDERVERALAVAFPDREVAEVEAAGVSWNPGNESVRATFEDGTAAYLKVATDGDPSRVRAERAALAYVGANRAVPVPKLLASSTDGEVPFVATAPLSGRNLAYAWGEYDERERAAAAREVGVALARLHDERFDRHGHVGGGDAAGLELDTGPWTDVLVDTIERLRAAATSDRFPESFDRVIGAVEANRDLLDRAPAALLHGDPAKPNTFRVDGGVGYVDWETAHVGDPARELYRVRDQAFDDLLDPAPDRIVDALHEGYRSVAGTLPEGYAERRPVYRAVRLLGTTGFFEATAEYVDMPESEFADWVERELDRRLSPIE